MSEKTAVVPASAGAVAHAGQPKFLQMLNQRPEGQLDGFEDYGLPRCWVKFDMPGRKLCCSTTNEEWTELVVRIVESRVVRVLKDRDGNVLCESSDRRVADEDTERAGAVCADCPDRGRDCQQYWQICWEGESGLFYAHTISGTGGRNFADYSMRLLALGLYPSDVLTRISVEQATRKGSNTTYSRLAFERVSDLDEQSADPHVAAYRDAQDAILAATATDEALDACEQLYAAFSKHQATDGPTWGDQPHGQASQVLRDALCQLVTVGTADAVKRALALGERCESDGLLWPPDWEQVLSAADTAKAKAAKG